MRKVAPESRAILTNEHAIAVSQDPLGQMGIRLSGKNATQVWARKLANGDVAVALYHKGDPEASTGYPADITVYFDTPGINLVGAVDVFDIWAKKSVGKFTSKYTASGVPFHGTAFVRLSLA
eukprot:SAG31_NODE_1491_length_8133_cov_8.084267_6_plen_122_part_00